MLNSMYSIVICIRPLSFYHRWIVDSYLGKQEIHTHPKIPTYNIEIRDRSSLVNTFFKPLRLMKATHICQVIFFLNVIIERLVELF